MAQATQLTPDEIERFREQLEGERDRLLATHSDTVPRRDVDAPPEPADAADIAEEERERTVSLSQADVDHDRLAQVTRALQKLDEGTYGLSDLTGDPIPLERLKAIPWATTNVDDPGARDAAPSRTREI